MSKIKNDGLDQYATEPFKQQQFETAGIEGVKSYAFCARNCWSVYVVKVACVAITEGLCVTGVVQLGVRDAARTQRPSSSDADAAQQITV